METLVNMVILPDSRIYAQWAYKAPVCQKIWGSFEEFYADYIYVTDFFEKTLHENQDYDIIIRYKKILDYRLKYNEKNNIKLAQSMKVHFWNMYLNQCYVADDTRAVFWELKKKYRLGLVSNFKVKGGIDEILKKTGITDFLSLKYLLLSLAGRNRIKRFMRKRLEERA
jgi:putative hydrolase of the HAD superfamily